MAEPWHLEGFGNRLDEWIDVEGPGDWLRMLVGNWVLSRIDDPYGGLRRESHFDNLWFGVMRIWFAELHPLALIYAVSGSAMISATLRIPKP